MSILTDVIKSLKFNGKVYQSSPERYGIEVSYKSGRVEELKLGWNEIMNRNDIWSKLSQDFRILSMLQRGQYRLEASGVKFQDGSTLRNPTIRETQAGNKYLIYKDIKFKL